MLECCIGTLWQLCFDPDCCIKLASNDGLQVIADVLGVANEPALGVAQTLAAQVLWVTVTQLDGVMDVCLPLASMGVVASCLRLAQDHGLQTSLRMACTRVLIGCVGTLASHSCA